MTAEKRVYEYVVMRVLRAENRMAHMEKMGEQGWRLCAVEASDYFRDFYWKRLQSEEKP